jgi:hypothetical protein
MCLALLPRRYSPRDGIDPVRLPGHRLSKSGAIARRDAAPALGLAVLLLLLLKACKPM